MMDWSTCPAVERDPQRVSGAWVFRGTRVPVAALFENLEDGAQVPSSRSGFPASRLNKFAPSSNRLRGVRWLPLKCAYCLTREYRCPCGNH
ncbi:MAG: DUF433 domain-containing protein [Gammaproteobacteria bacterium]